MKIRLSFLRIAFAALTLLAVGRAQAAPDVKSEPSLGLFEFIGSWQDPSGKLVDWEDLRNLPDLPASRAASTPAAAVPPLTWEKLPEPVQKTLGPLRDGFDKLASERRVAVANGARHWGGLDAQQQSMWFARFDRWSRIDAKERDRILARFARWSRLSDDERRAAFDQRRSKAGAKRPAEAGVEAREGQNRGKREAFAAERRQWMEGLSRERRQQMKAHLQSLSDEERRELRVKLQGMSAEERKKYMRDSFGKP